MNNLSELTYDSQDRNNLIVSEIRDLRKYKSLIIHLIQRNVTARYKRSVLGVTWTLLDPLATMLIMSVIFTSFFGKNMPAYAVFLLSGLIIWNFIAQGSTGSITDLINGSWLTGKVFMPKTVFMITAIGSSLVNLLISLIPLAIIVAIQKVSLTAAIAFLPVSLLIIILFTAGLGLISSTLAVFFNDAINIHNIALRIIMYLSGIFYVAESLPIDFQPFVKANPFYNLITLFRDPIYFGRLPDQWTIIYSFIWAIALFSFGVFVFLKFSDQFTYRV